MADDPHHGVIIIVKKKGGGSHRHHGGAWKIAFADFMTAMMAFFLVLWIINASDKETKTVTARYFNPLKLENPAKAKKGVHGAIASQTDNKEEKSDKSPGPPTKDADSEAKGERTAPETKDEHKEKAAPKIAPPPAEAKLQAAEEKLFSTPYESLERIAGGAANAAPGASAEKGDADPQRLAGALSIDSFRDPFKPVGPGAPDDPVAFDADARSKEAPNLEPSKTGQDVKPRAKPLAEATPAPKPRDKPSPAEEASKSAELAKAERQAAEVEKELKAKVEALDPTTPATLPPDQGTAPATPPDGGTTPPGQGAPTPAP